MEEHCGAICDGSRFDLARIGWGRAGHPVRPSGYGVLQPHGIALEEMLSGSERTAQQAQQAWWHRVATSIRAKLLSLDRSSLSCGDTLVIVAGCGVSRFTMPFSTLTLRSALAWRGMRAS